MKYLIYNNMFLKQMPENVLPINYFIKCSRILFMRYFCRKLYKWSFSEKNVGDNSERSVRIIKLWSNEGTVFTVSV